MSEGNPLRAVELWKTRTAASTSWCSAQLDSPGARTCSPKSGANHHGSQSRRHGWTNEERKHRNGTLGCKLCWRQFRISSCEAKSLRLKLCWRRLGNPFRSCDYGAWEIGPSAEDLPRNLGTSSRSSSRRHRVGRHRLDVQLDLFALAVRTIAEFEVGCMVTFVGRYDR